MRRATFATDPLAFTRPPSTRCVSTDRHVERTAGAGSPSGSYIALRSRVVVCWSRVQSQGLATWRGGSVGLVEERARRARTSCPLTPPPPPVPPCRTRSRAPARWASARRGRPGRPRCSPAPARARACGTDGVVGGVVWAGGFKGLALGARRAWCTRARGPARGASPSRAQRAHLWSRSVKRRATLSRPPPAAPPPGWHRRPSTAISLVSASSAAACGCRRLRWRAQPHTHTVCSRH